MKLLKTDDRETELVYYGTPMTTGFVRLLSSYINIDQMVKVEDRFTSGLVPARTIYLAQTTTLSDDIKNLRKNKKRY